MSQQPSPFFQGPAFKLYFELLWQTNYICYLGFLGLLTSLPIPTAVIITPARIRRKSKTHHYDSQFSEESTSPLQSDISEPSRSLYGNLYNLPTLRTIGGHNTYPLISHPGTTSRPHHPEVSYLNRVLRTCCNPFYISR